jgi:hypothetical protein
MFMLAADVNVYRLGLMYTLLVSICKSMLFTFNESLASVYFIGLDGLI